MRQVIKTAIPTAQSRHEPTRACCGIEEDRDIDTVAAQANHGAGFRGDRHHAAQRRRLRADNYPRWAIVSGSFLAWRSASSWSTCWVTVLQNVPFAPAAANASGSCFSEGRFTNAR